MKEQQGHTVLNLSRTDHIKDVQLAFNKAYPFLKIEFYKEPPAVKARQRKYMEGSLCFAAAGLTDSGSMVISDVMTVYQLEKEVKNTFGLNAHMFRKSGSIWLEITMSGNWTLKHQNQE